MSVSDNFGTSSNERKNQRMIRLKKDFFDKKVITVESAVQKLGLNRNTIIKYCKEFDIPLIDVRTGNSVVELTADNRPNWLN